MKKMLLMLLAGMGTLFGLFVIFIAVMALRSKPLPTIAQVLRELPPAERQTVEALSQAANIAPDSLRPIYGWDDRTMTHPLNHLNIGLRNGHIAGLRIAAKNLRRLPDLSALPELEALWLDGNQLEAANLQSLSKLQTINLSANRITSLQAWRFPSSLRRLLLSENQIADLAPLSGLSALFELNVANNKIVDLSPLSTLRSLKQLDAANNQILAFDALVPLALEKLNLRQNRIMAFPQQLPSPPTWSVNLDGNPVLNRPGYLRDRTYKFAYAGTGGGNLTQKGSVRGGAFELEGTWQHLPALRNVSLNAPHDMTRSMGPVTLEASVKKGRVRFYLHAPANVWNTPWIDKGIIEGYGGFVHTVDWVYADADEEHPARLFGHLLDGGSYDQAQFEFHMEPLDGPAEEISYRIFRK